MSLPVCQKRKQKKKNNMIISELFMRPGSEEGTLQLVMAYQINDIEQTARKPIR